MRLVLGAVALAATLAMSGCLDYDEVLTLAQDGSGSLKVDLTLDVAFVEKLKALEPQQASEDSGDLRQFVSKDAIQRNCETKEGKLKTCEVEEKGTKTRVKLEFEFPNLEVLRSIQGFSDRKLELVESGDQVEVVYRFDARSMLNALGLVQNEGDPKPTTDLEKKMQAIIDEARESSSARFTLKLPGKIAATTGKKTEDETGARWEIPRKDAKAHEAVLKGPLAMRATIAKKDFAPAFLAREKSGAKPAKADHEGEDKASPATPGKPGD